MNKNMEQEQKITILKRYVLSRFLKVLREMCERIWLGRLFQSFEVLWENDFVAAD